MVISQQLMLIFFYRKYRKKQQIIPSRGKKARKIKSKLMIKLNWKQTQYKNLPFHCQGMLESSRLQTGNNLIKHVWTETERTH